MHRECGFIRLEPDTNKVAFVSAQNTGACLPGPPARVPCQGPVGTFPGRGAGLQELLCGNGPVPVSDPTHVCASPVFPVLVGLRGDLNRE